MAIFNQTDFSNLTNVTQILEVADNFSGGYLGIGIWLMILFGTFFILSRYDFRQGIIASTFVSVIVSIFLSFLGILNGNFVMISIGLFTVSIVLALTIKGNQGA